MNMILLKDRGLRWEIFNIIRLLGGENSRILVVDDEPFNIRGIEMLFKKAPLLIHPALSEEAAIQLLL